MSKPRPLVRGQYYHVFNRGNNREDIFKEERNYEYFMRLLCRHVLPIADIYAYCFLLNHFHLLVRIRTESTVDPSASHQCTRSTPSQRFGNCFNAYAKAINSAYDRTGALFQRPFGRRVVRSRDYFMTLVKYIHVNPQSHGMIEHFWDWPHSSFEAFLNPDQSLIERATVLQLFGGIKGFLTAHTEAVRDETVARIDEPVKQLIPRA